MLNSSGDELTDAEITAKSAEPGPGFVVLLSQVVLILLAGSYLLGMVWLYLRFPWLAVLVAGVAVLFMVAGAVGGLNRTSPTRQE